MATPSRAPTCVTCHMPESSDEGHGASPLIHDVSTNLTLGTVAQGARLAGTALPVPMRTITSDEFTAKRAKHVGDLRPVPCAGAS